LGIGEADAQGNVNVSHLGGNLIGPGGFIEIAQNAKKVVFCGSFDAAGTRLEYRDGKLNIIQAGKVKKFVDHVERITFSGDFARKQNQEVLYVTERAVFKLASGGLELIEVAPGIDIEKDIIPYMSFHPHIGSVKPMPSDVFK
jgi:acyl CoA:acetate/3-ketoacid CoA transferase